MRKLVALLKKYPKLTYAVFLIVTVGLGLEIALRFLVGFNPSYYMGYKDKKPGAVIDYAYGTISINDDGFPDENFLPTKQKPRVAYIGDSVCYGVGAGFGYRISELLEKEYPEFEHMNMSFGVGSGIFGKTTSLILEWHEQYDIDTYVYLMNLNDVLPNRKDAVKKQSKIIGSRRLFDWLRGRSYLYTYVRLIIKNYYTRQGIEITNQRMYELFPEEFQEIFDATCERIRNLNDELEQRGSKFVIVMVPYEMQISKDAEETYTKAGITWGDEFIERSTQRELQKRLTGLNVIDAYDAFVGSGVSRDDISVGECFVYNKGDKLDWNHPNRLGHQRIADFLKNTGLLSSQPKSMASEDATSATP